MKKPRLPKIHYGVFLPFATLFLILLVIFPRNAKFSYDYRKGSPWTHETLIAQFDFPILKTDDQLREEKSANRPVEVPYYIYREDVVSNSMKAAEEADLGEYSSLRPAIVSSMMDTYSNGVVSDEGVKLDSRAKKDPDAILYIHKDKRVSKKPASEVLKESDAKAKLLDDVSKKAKGANADSILNASGIYNLIAPNLEYDPKTTELVNAQNDAQISPTQGFVSAGQLIVSKGEIVTAEVAQILDSYKVEYEANMGYGGPKLLFWLGNALIAALLVFLIFITLYFSNNGIFKERNRFLYILFVFLLITVVTLAVNKFAPKFLYMVPFTLTALFLEAFFKNKVIIPQCFISLLPLLIFSSNGIVLFVMFMAGSLVAIYTFKFFNRSWMQFISALFVFATMALTYFGFRMIDMVNDNPYQALLFLFISSMLSVAGYPLVYLFERMFNLVSNSRLRELCDTNNPLLRQLEHLAPGTFQHSLQVMNMADAAARAIDANELLVSAGALYHDIGKMKNPLCFIENGSMSPGGAHYHDNLTPKESAKAIIKHVDDGLELADKYKLPEVIKEFIRTHHGTSATAYFYNKYLNEGGDPNDVADFFYHGAKPYTKEQTILMICDTVEAASRTLKENSEEAFSEFVERMVATKMDAGQLDNSTISLRQLCTLKQVLKDYLKQIFHERIEYPNRKGGVGRLGINA
jgi:putative nucleotidyltransferase with HDIG domain